MTAPTMIPCDHVIAKLWEYVDGELTGEMAAAVQAHLEICSRCFPQYDFQRAFKEFLSRSSRRPLPPELRRRVFTAILEAEGAAPDPNGSDAGGSTSSHLLERLLRLLPKRYRRSG